MDIGKLKELKQLFDEGVLTADEYEKLKSKIVNELLTDTLINETTTNEVKATKQKTETIETIRIGTHEWMKYNLDVDKFRNGDPIPHAKTEEEWKRAGENKKPAWCYYDNKPANGKKYGKLYNWFAVNDPRGLAPIGFHVPSDAEWDEMISFLWGDEEDGTMLKSKTGWNDDEGKSGNGTDKYGFAGAPGGLRYNYGYFNFIGSFGKWLEFYPE